MLNIPIPWENTKKGKKTTAIVERQTIVETIKINDSITLSRWCISVRDVHRIFSRGGQNFLGGGQGLANIYLLSYNNAETGHFLPLLTQKLLKLPRNKVKHRNRTGERSEPRKFLEYECSKPIFGVYFRGFLGNFSVSTFCGPILGGGQTRIRGGGQCPTCPPPLCTSLISVFQKNWGVGKKRNKVSSRLFWLILWVFVRYKIILKWSFDFKHMEKHFFVYSDI